MFSDYLIRVISLVFRIPRVTVTQDEGHVDLEISDDPYDVQTVDVKSAPCIVTLSKVQSLFCECYRQDVYLVQTADVIQYFYACEILTTGLKYLM